MGLNQSRCNFDIRPIPYKIRDGAIPIRFHHKLIETGFINLWHFATHMQAQIGDLVPTASFRC
jgi:hypothetical protein